MIFSFGQAPAINTSKLNEHKELDYFFISDVVCNSFVCLGREVALSDGVNFLLSSLNQKKNILIINELPKSQESMNPNTLKSSHLIINDQFIYISMAVRKKIKLEQNSKLLNYHELKSLLNQQLKKYLSK